MTGRDTFVLTKKGTEKELMSLYLSPDGAYLSATQEAERIEMEQQATQLALRAEFVALKEAAERSDPEAQLALGIAHLDGGHGLIERNPEIAAGWIKKAAERGLSKAQFRMGILYQNGVGVEKSSDRADEWYARAGESGTVEDQYQLGILYAHGFMVHSGGDATKDEGKALHWYRAAAERGHAPSQAELAELYREGRGTPPDILAAHMWIKRALAQEEDPEGWKPYYLEEFKKIEAQMTPAQLEEARTRGN